jgi:ABC-type Zn uptake system ZnuABC Zn-binding protein ZnuA
MWVALLALVLTAGFAIGCGSEDEEATQADAAATEESDGDADDAADASEDAETDTDGEAVDKPTVAVTTSVLGDVVTQIVGSQADIFTVMPPGADPHDFQPSAQEVGQLLDADVLVTNGGFFEEGLLDVIDQASDDGIPVFEALESVSTLEAAEGGHSHDHGDDHGDEEKDEDHDHGDEDGHDHGDEEKDEDHDHGDEDGHDHGDEDKDEDHDHGDEEKDEDHDHGDEHDGHDHGDTDPHFFTDPNRMSEAVTALSAFLAAEVPGIDEAQLATDTTAYLDELKAVDAEIADTLSSIPDSGRILVTNHDVFAYFADQYGFEVVGVVIPSGSTNDAASAGELAELIETIQAEQVPAIFADSSGTSDLAETIAGDVGDIEVVALYTESLGEAGSDGDSYLSMLRTNASRISAALS